jgi:SAM-dependent methyltransferase
VSDIEVKQKTEIEFWRDSIHESPEANSIHNLINKASFFRVLADCFNRHVAKLSSNGNVLELGSGQGWASCLYKRLHPDAKLTVTDISKYAIMSLPAWERIFEVEIDKSYDCKSYETNEEAASLDFIYCFAAAHHFLAHKRTLKEISRILKPEGTAIFFFEPATPKYLYRLSKWRVNRIRPEVPEDVLITSELDKIAREAGLDMVVDYYPTLLNRGPLESVYFAVLAQLPILQRILPCSANFLFTKRAAD